MVQSVKHCFTNCECNNRDNCHCTGGMPVLKLTTFYQCNPGSVLLTYECDEETIKPSATKAQLENKHPPEFIGPVRSKWQTSDPAKSRVLILHTTCCQFCKWLYCTHEINVLTRNNPNSQRPYSSQKLDVYVIHFSDGHFLREPQYTVTCGKFAHFVTNTFVFR